MDFTSAEVAIAPTSSAPMLTSTNNENTLTQFQRLTLNTASETALPPSPHISSPHKPSEPRNYPPSPSGRQPPRSPLSRSPSSTSFDARSTTPSLHRKASMNSLHGVGGATPPRASSSRRSSSTQLTNGHPPPVMGKSPLSGIDDGPSAPKALTAAAIAVAHFKAELESQAEGGQGRISDTVVILHDSCYGHRYSRPRTSKANLSLIVERPERIHASILGVSVAYVRLGQRHSEGRYSPHPKKDASNIPNIPFRIQKTARRLALSSPAVVNVHGTKWMEELKIMCEGAEAKLAMTGKELTRPEMSRSPEQGVPPKLHEGDLYLCAESLEAMEGALGAVCEGVDAVFKGSTNGVGPHRAFVAIRPPGHHCSASYPSGFCWLNNVHVGISHAALNYGLTHAAIIDFDLHHGDGSQAITWEHNTHALNLPKNAPAWKKTSIGYFSLHDINSYPCEMGDEEKVKNASLCIDNAHGQSIWNVHLQPWRSEHEFWDLYETKYAILLEKTRAFLKTQTERLRSLPNPVQPRAAIFLSAGFDASEWESSGMQRHKVNVPTEFYARLTRDVVKLAAEEGCSVEGRIISVLEGGYSDRALSSGVLSHISGLAGADPVTVKSETGGSGLGYEMAQKFGAVSKTEPPTEHSAKSVQPYDSIWWALPQLELLDAIVHPPAPAPEPKKPKDNAPPTYFAPTQSSAAKVSTTPKIHRMASKSSLNGGSPRPVERPQSPPPPEVPWTVAAHELSKLLIPSDRQTMSCKPEDLSAEASRARRDRQSILMQPVPPPMTSSSAAPATRMALRERKLAKPLTTPEEAEDIDKAVSKANRRKTVAGEAVLATENATIPKAEPGYKQPTKQSSRRLSLMSNAETSSSQNSHSRAPSISSSVLTQGGPNSQSNRPGSSMSSRGQPAPPVVVKKTRTINSTRSEATKTARTRKKSPSTANISKSYGGDGAQDSPVILQNAKSASGHRASDNTPTDVDSITSGMKKITINIPSKAQREAKEKAKIAVPVGSSGIPGIAATKSSGVHPEQDRAAPPQVSYADPFTKEPTLPASYPLTKSAPPSTNPSIVPSTPQPLAASRFAHLQDASKVPLPASSPPMPSVPYPESSAPKAEPMLSGDGFSNVFVPYQPEGPTHAPIPQQEPLKWLPPNTSTPAAMKRTELPVFTSTTPIPFGATAIKGSLARPPIENGSTQGVAANAIKQEKSQTSIWEVPDTPQR